MSSKAHQKTLWFRLLPGVLLLTVFAGLALTILSLPDPAMGLKVEVASKMPLSGVTHPVTAVLINFRGYDTLLEMAVLFLALVGVWSLAPAAQVSGQAPGPVLERLTQLYAPLMLLVAGYLLWNGAHAPGGAFQAGAVFGGACVLLLLTGRRLNTPLTSWPLRLALILGLAVFGSVAAVLLWHSGALLKYPPQTAGLLILFIETAATLSIGVTLAALFIGGRPGDEQ